MKTILVPTDFSTSAEHATLYAAELAKTMNASVLLMHVYMMPVAISDFPVLVVTDEELKKNANETLQKAKEVAQKAEPGVQFEAESKMGDVVEEISEICASREIVAVVVGTKDRSGFERFLMGNTTLSIVKNCAFPVITVQESASIKVPKKIALAVDEDDKIPVEKIKAFIQLLGAELHVVHVETHDKPTPVHLPGGLAETTYHSLKEGDVSEGLHHFVEQHSIDLVLILPHKHNLFERIFFKGHTSELIKEMPVPVLSIH